MRWPVVDVAVTGIGVVGLAVTGVQYWKTEDDHTQDVQQRENRMTRLKLQAAGAALWTFVWGLSANIGAFRVYACQDAHSLANGS